MFLQIQLDIYIIYLNDMEVLRRLQCNLCHVIEQVTPKLPEDDWFMRGGLNDQEADITMEEDDGNTFFYQKW